MVWPMNWDGVTIDATILGAKLRRVNALRAKLTFNPHPIHSQEGQQIRADAKLNPEPCDRSGESRGGSVTLSKAGINKVEITVTPSDVYNVRFFRIRGTVFKLINEFDDVYCDQLQDIFESATGIYTTLSRRAQ